MTANVSVAGSHWQHGVLTRYRRTLIDRKVVFSLSIFVSLSDDVRAGVFMADARRRLWRQNVERTLAANNGNCSAAISWSSRSRNHQKRSGASRNLLVFPSTIYCICTSRQGVKPPLENIFVNPSPFPSYSNRSFKLKGFKRDKFTILNIFWKIIPHTYISISVAR